MIYVIRMVFIRLCADVIGDLVCCTDILRVEICLAGQCKGNIAPIPCNNTRVLRIRSLIRGEIIFCGIRCVLSVAVIGLGCLDSRIPPLLVDLEIIGRDPAARDRALEVEICAC